MANVVKKHSISSELAQKMVDEAVTKAKELGVTENVAIVDDGGNLKAFSRMDGAPILSIQMAQNKAYTALFGVSTQDFFDSAAVPSRRPSPNRTTPGSMPRFNTLRISRPFPCYSAASR